MRLQRGCFSVNIAKFLRTTVLRNIWDKKVFSYIKDQKIWKLEQLFQLIFGARKLSTPWRRKWTSFSKNTSQWQLLALLFLSKFLCERFQTLLALYTKDIVGSFAQWNFEYIEFFDTFWLISFFPSTQMFFKIFLRCKHFLKSVFLLWKYTSQKINISEITLPRYSF